MGLINQERRQRNRLAKKERKVRILEAAQSVFMALPFATVSLEDISRRAKVRDGLPTLYFGSKEELFLQLLGREVRDWSESLAAELATISSSDGACRLASVVAASLADRPALTRMLSLLHVVLEQDTDVEAAQTFTLMYGERVRRLGAVLEDCGPRLGNGDGARLMFRVLAIASALHPAIRPTGMAAPSVRGMGAFETGFSEELESLIAALLGSVSSDGDG